MHPKTILQLCCLVVPLAITACGGGGGNASSGAGNNTAPVANNDSYSTIDQGGSITITASAGVLNNDSDANNDPLTALLISNVNNGMLTLNPNGSFVYTHDGSTNASDTFTYRANDGSAQSNVATVSLSIDINIPPSAALFCDNTAESATFNGDLNSVVSDPDDTLLEFTQLSDPTSGTVSNFGVDGTFSYIPTGDFRGTDSFTFMVDDLNGGTATETVQIIVGRTRIMPLGDSITRGSGSRIGSGMEPPPIGATLDPLPEFEVGYRQSLFDSLNNNDFAVDFVGTQSSVSVVDFAENQHEGHPSIGADDIVNGRMDVTTNSIINFVGLIGLVDALGSDPNPIDIILLHIGTNDISGSSPDPVNTIVGSVESILTAIDNINTDIVVVLARIIGLRNNTVGDNDDPNNDNVLALNNAVVAMAQTRINNGDNIIIVDMESNLDPQTMLHDDTSGAHPTAAGYEIMADIWLRPLAGGTMGTATGTGVASAVGEFDGNALLARCPA